ncbi:MAG TPA: lactate utilization protein [Candidatus Scatomonas merdavium]|nr:lactate utilization protein [Candidatus Scatomonas merdavium]
MSFKKESYALQAESLIRRFNRRGMEACYCEDSKAAVEKVLSLIPDGSSVTWGGSATLSEAGILEALQNGSYELIDRASAKSPEEARSLYGKIVCADYFLMSTNAFTSDGELVNIDGNGNRVACLISGPAHVIVVTGMNKLTKTVQEAVDRVQTCATPPNCLRLNLNTPCASTGFCADCQSPDSICCQIVVTRRSRQPGRITVVMVGEELGF